jgi:hypothetical protein
MRLNELIDSESIEKVSGKTNISIANIEFLLNENFERLNRVKALGFLLIFEREYRDIDVQELRERIKLYFEEAQVSSENVVSMSREPRPGESISFFKWFVVLGLLGGGYYLYTQGQLDGLLEKVEDKKDFFDASNVVDANISEADANKIVIKDNETKSVVIENVSTVNTNEAVSAVSQTVSEGAVVSESTSPTTSTIIVESVEGTAISSEPVIVSELVEETTTLPSISTITINPTRGMLWYGFINIDTKKRKEFMKKVSTPFDIKDGRWLLVTGHGYVDIVSDGHTVEVADSKKHYFYIDSSEIKEISKKEFRSMNGRRGW